MLAVRGEKNGKSKLTWEQVKKIKKLYPALSYQKIADIYKVNKTTIARIIKNTGWKGDISQ
jgi:DNA invertase Pin-like site-specific DNA recombinase